MRFRSTEPAPSCPDLHPPRSLQRLLDSAGIAVGGPQPCDLQVHEPRLYGRVLRQGSLGLGEAYMDGWWDCPALDQFFTRLLALDADRALPGLGPLAMALEGLRHRLRNLQSATRAFEVGRAHYDAGNDVFEAMLDPRMIYSCAYWEHATDLTQAQRDKLAMIGRKLELAPGLRLLDIGCGWGGLAAFAAERHGAHVTGITVSQQQLELARLRTRGLPVELHLMDYRGMQGRFDRIVSVGMFEHVGPKNYDAFFGHAARLLERDGLFLLHTIGVHRPQPATDPWIDRYVFPNGKLPAASELARALEPHFVLEDWHHFGPDYDRTLMAWHENFERAWPQLRARYDERFRRRWRYYLLCCAGFFRSRQGQLWQLVLSPRARQAVYRSFRPRGAAG